MKRPTIVIIKNGLGNQMFQYAFARYISKVYKKKVYLVYRPSPKTNPYVDGLLKHEILGIDKLKISLKLIPSLKANILKKLYLIPEIKVETDYLIKEINSSKLKPKILDGWWMTEYYAKKIRPTIIKEFVPQKIDENTKKTLKKIKTTKSVCLHVRRGDMLKIEGVNKKHGGCSIKYYQKAIKKIKEQIKNPIFFVFSDDISWCKKNFKGEEFIFMEDNLDYPEKDIYLMSNCKHFIIANSTFSWWSAWLSQNKEKIVIAPTPWFDEGYLDLILNSWIKIPKE